MEAFHGCNRTDTKISGRLSQASEASLLCECTGVRCTMEDDGWHGTNMMVAPHLASTQ